MTPTVERLLSTSLSHLRILKSVIMANAMDSAQPQGQVVQDFLFCCSPEYIGSNSTSLSNSCGHPGYPLLENIDFEGAWGLKHTMNISQA